MGASDRFSRRESQRILDVTDKQLNYWERLQLVSPRKGGTEKFYDFRDLIALRAAKQLIEKGVSANRLRRSLVALNEKDRKSTRLNSSHANISYAVFCLKKKKKLTRSCLLIKDN